MLAYTATVSGNTATFTGNSSGGTGDIVIFAQSGGFLVHNRGVLDPGFVSDFDFDSTMPSEQKLPVSAATTINLTTGTGPDLVQVGGSFSSFSAPASQVLASFHFNNNNSPNKQVAVDDSGSVTPNTYTVADHVISGTGINVAFDGTGANTVVVSGSSGADTFNVKASPTDPISLFGNNPTMVAPGDVLNFDGQFQPAMDNGTSISQAGKQSVFYSNFETVNLTNLFPDPADLVVRNTNDDGSGSLRRAIGVANAIMGPNTITFAIPTAGVHTITPLSALPDITDPVTIDGYTQSGATANTLAVGDNANLLIELDGTNAGVASSGLTIGDSVGSGAGSVVRGLVINRFGRSGIRILADGCTVAGNFIGTDPTGNLARGNRAGISVIDAGSHTFGGATPADRNVISGNGADGINSTIGTMNVDDIQVLGNYIGTNAAGTADLGNGGTGIIFVGSHNLIANNLISGNDNVGIFATGSAQDNRIEGNLIGTNASGNAPLGNSGNSVLLQSTGNTVGGSQTALRNVISGNGNYGVSLAESNNTVQGNYIGTDATGNLAIGNVLGGVLSQFGFHDNLVGGTTPAQGNLISGNLDAGIRIEGDSNSVYGNRIGTNADGTAPLSNLVNGVAIIDGTGNRIGGLNPGQGNVIAFTSGTGVFVGPTALMNPILSNSIFSNGLLGIDLRDFLSSPAVSNVGDGPTPNDGAADLDDGGNNLQNFPELTSAVASGVNTAVKGSLTSEGQTQYLLQFFADPLGDPSGFGEGRVLLGSVVVETSATGFVQFAADLPVAAAAGQRVSATATALTSVNPVSPTDTSEFSGWVTVSGPPPQISVSDVTVTEGNNVPVNAAFQISLSGASTVPTVVTFTTADGTAKQPDDYLAQTQTVTFNPGETTKTVNVTVNPDMTVEGTETFLVNLSNASGGQILDGQGVGTILDGTVVPPPATPYFTISDVTETEGNSGTKQFVFTVTRNGGTAGAASVQFQTQNQTAGSGDYDAKSGALNFANGDATKQISITVKGDTKAEGDESFRIILSNPTGATIAGGNGIGKILNDDGVVPPPPPPALKTLSISDAMITEGNSGTKTLNFTVTLSGAAGSNVVVKFRTQNQTAGSGDYDAKTGTITFTPGQTSKTISITIKGDTKVEGNETFRVELFENMNATILDGTGIGTIKNDD